MKRSRATDRHSGVKISFTGPTILLPLHYMVHTTMNFVLCFVCFFLRLRRGPRRRRGMRSLKRKYGPFRLIYNQRLPSSFPEGSMSAQRSVQKATCVTTSDCGYVAYQHNVPIMGSTAAQSALWGCSGKIRQIVLRSWVL